MIRKNNISVKFNNQNIINELHNERLEQHTYNNEISYTIYNMCINNIKMINNLGGTNIKYEVPLFLYGFPLYNIKTISIILLNKFKKNGFSSIYIKPNILLLSWKKKKI